MNYIVTALDAEARPLIEAQRLKRHYTLPYPLYRNDETLLIVTGMGKNNTLMAVSALLGWRIPQEGDCLVNIGICGAPCGYTIGEALLIHQIIEGEKAFYPDILYPHPLREASIVCVEGPQSEAHDFPVDMESSAVFQAASRFFKLHQMAFIKIVSDHFSPQSLTKEGVMELIGSNFERIDAVLRPLSRVQGTQSLFNAQERETIDTLKSRFTKSQGDRLEDAFLYRRLKNPSLPLPILSEIPDSKRERSRLLEELIATLTT